MREGFRFCPRCGAPIERKIPPGDDRPRDVCSRDGDVFYQNPLPVVGCIPEWEGRILLCRRSIEPRAGFWTLPAGFLELGETTAEAGARETWEEARAKVIVGSLFSFIDIAHIGQAHMFYLAKMVEEAHAPGPESAETRLVREDEIPWRELAFPTIYRTLEFYFADRRTGTFGMHTEYLVREDWQCMRLKKKPSAPVSAA